jgi:hypothetical protein
MRRLAYATCACGIFTYVFIASMYLIIWVISHLDGTFEVLIT